jgi:hypothetical protein
MDAFFKIMPFATAPGLQRMFTPTSNRNRDYLINSWMPARNFRKAFLNHPIKANARYRS